NSVTTTAYDDLGDVTQVTDPVGNWTKDGYDKRGRKVSETEYGISGTATYAYDQQDHLLSSTDLNGHATSYAYDDFGRNIAQSWTNPDGIPETLRYGYDADDQVIYSEDARGTPGSATEIIARTNYNYSLDPLRRLYGSTSTTIDAAN